MPPRLQLLGVGRVGPQVKAAPWLLRPPRSCPVLEHCRQVSVQSSGWRRMALFPPPASAQFEEGSLARLGQQPVFTPQA